MLVPSGLLQHHQFTVLSKGVQQELQMHYVGDSKFSLGLSGEDVLVLRDHWIRRSPNVTDGETIVHLSGVIVSGHGKVRIACSPAQYFDFLFSNYSLDIPLRGGTLRERAARKSRVPFIGVPLKNSLVYRLPRFGNSVGITVCVISSDGKFVAAQRSNDAKGMAHDHGKWLAAVGTQIKRHQPRFLNEKGEPDPLISAQQGLRDEMGAAVAESCSPLVCMGVVYRTDFMHCEVLYETQSSLSYAELEDSWRKTEVPDRREIAAIEGIDITEPHALLTRLADPLTAWSPQHAAGALHSLARRFPWYVDAFGLDFGC